MAWLEAAAASFGLRPRRLSAFSRVPASGCTAAVYGRWWDLRTSPVTACAVSARMPWHYLCKVRWPWWVRYPVGTGVSVATRVANRLCSSRRAVAKRLSAFRRARVNLYVIGLGLATAKLQHSLQAHRGDRLFRLIYSCSFPFHACSFTAAHGRVVVTAVLLSTAVPFLQLRCR